MAAATASGSKSGERASEAKDRPSVKRRKWDADAQQIVEIEDGHHDPNTGSRTGPEPKDDYRPRDISIADQVKIARNRHRAWDLKQRRTKNTDAMRRKRQAEEHWHRRNRDLDKKASAHRGSGSSLANAAREMSSNSNSFGQGPSASHDDSDRPVTCSARGRSRSPIRGAAARAEYCARFESELSSSSMGIDSSACLQAAGLLEYTALQHNRAAEPSTDGARPSNWEQPPMAHDAPHLVGSNVGLMPDNVDINTLRSLLDLHDFGEKVLWPPGVDLLLVRRWVYQ